MFKQKKLNTAIAVLCVVLILSGTFVIFLGHSHGPCDSDCTICALIESSKEFFASLVCCSAIWQVLHFGYSLTASCCCNLSKHNTTPVGLKVKLSD